LPTTGKIIGHYNPHEVEDWVKNFWTSNRVYELVKNENSKCIKKFNFIDGPPYASSDTPHIGSAWNKTLKDIVLRFKRMNGYRVNDTPGYDCHGLPIEVKIEQKLNIRFKKEIEERIGVERFVNECKKFVIENIKSLTKWFMELGVFMDWSNPYLTMTDDYIDAEWWLIKKIDELGLLTCENRVVYWCPRCSTTLAEYEIEYHEIEDPSIIVKLPVKDRDKEYLLIWTTTPWTLPANTFVMIHPDEKYVRIRIGDETYIIAKKRLEYLLKTINTVEYTILEEFKGSDILGLEYIHPLEDIVTIQRELRKYHKVVASREYVTMYEGTGLVHGAPGHGFEDFNVAKQYGIELIASPVDDEGRFTDEAGKYSGLNVREANELIIRDLKERNYLLHSSVTIHKYPVCWRCKTPVIMRAIPQWIIRVSLLKNKLIEEVNKVNWIPEWGLDRIKHMIENVQDWILSRQRFWGTPLPIWICSNNHRLVIGSREELVKYNGYIPEELHKPWIDRVYLKCPLCGSLMKRVPDVVDVWFDSAVCFYASRKRPFELDLNDIILDFIVEGHDQVRGWFFSLLRAGVLGFDQSPYRTVLIHGFALDEQGREMHKSLGNYVGLDEVIARVGRDPFRLWISQNTVWEDIRFSWKSIEETRRIMDIIWNTFVFASTYMELDKFDPVLNRLEDYIEYLRIEDKWILSRINNLVDKVTDYLNNYRIHEAARLLGKFIVEDLSHWYIRLIRPRIWIEENTVDKLAAYTTLYYVLFRWLVLSSVFIPHLSEYIYQNIYRKADPKLPLSIHLMKWPSVDKQYIDPILEKEMEFIKEVYESVAAARMKAGIKLRYPVKRVLIYTRNSDLIETLNKYSDLLKRIVNTRSIEIRDIGKISELVSYIVTPIYKSIGPKYRDIAKKIFEYIDSNQNNIARDIINKGEHVVYIDNIEVKLTSIDVSITPSYLEGYVVEEREWGSVAIDTKLSIDEISEGIARDIVRRIQVMRKEIGLELDAKIETYIYGPSDQLELIEKHSNYIMNETRSTILKLLRSIDEINNVQGYRREWLIDEDLYIIVIKKK